MKSTPPTMMDVARRAKVSVGTVSNTLNGTTWVSEAKRNRVLKAVEDLGYTQNLLAQGLRRHRSPLVGLCVPFTSISYFAALVDAFEEVALDRGYEILQVLSQQAPDRELARVSSLLRYRVGGIVLLPSLDPEATLDLIATSGIPAVIVDRPIADDRFDQVTFDNFAAMHEAAARLIGLGHQRILFLVRHKTLSVTQDRVEGLRAAIREVSHAVTLSVIECSGEEPAFMVQLGLELGSERRPTAIIVSNSTLTKWTLQALRSLGIAVPRDISLLAFDEPEWSELVQPALSVVRPPTRAIAMAAWEILVRRMRGEAAGVEKVELRAEVIFRQSVGPAPRSGRSGNGARKSKPPKTAAAT